MTNEYDMIEVELGGTDLGSTHAIRTFKNVTNFKQTGLIGTMEFNYTESGTENASFTYHAELYGRVVSKIKRV